MNTPSCEDYSVSYNDRRHLSRQRARVYSPINLQTVVFLALPETAVRECFEHAAGPTPSFNHTVTSGSHCCGMVRCAE